MNAPENIDAGDGQDTNAGQSTEPSQTPVLVVPECNSSQELAEFCGTLEATLSRAPKTLTLRFVGVHQMVADHALVLHQLLSAKLHKTLLITDAWSSLIDASVLIWLLGERRRIRPTAWLFLRKPRASYDPVPFFWPGPPMEVCDRDHHTVLRLINHYLPVGKLMGSPMTGHMLAEYCLLEEQSSRAGEDT
jgi:hypothetical protein